MKKVVSYFSLTSMVTNNFCDGYCDKFKFKIEEQEEKDKKVIFDQIYNLLESKGICKYLDFNYEDNNDSFFVIINKDGIEFFDIFSDVCRRYRNISKFKDYFSISYDEWIYNYQDYEKAKKYITGFKTKEIVYDDTNVNTYNLQKRLEQLKKEVFLDQDYGFYILKDSYYNLIKKEFPEFTIKYDGEFTISVNTEYCEHKKDYKDLYTFKVYVDESKIKNKDYYLINNLTEEKIKNVEIKYNYYKLQSLFELKHFADVELNKELELHHSRSIKLCDNKGKILDKTDELPKGTYYIKLDLFKSRSVKAFLDKEKLNFKEFDKKLDEIVKNKADYKNKIQSLYEELENYNSKFFEKHQNLDTLKERDEDYSNLHSKILDFKGKITGTLTIFQFLDEINSDLKKINIKGDLIDENLFKYNDEKNRINKIASLCIKNKKVYEVSSNVNFKKDEIKEIIEVYNNFAKGKDGLKRYCNRYVFDYISRDLCEDFDNKVDELSKKYEEYLKSLQVNTEYELDTSKMKCHGFSKEDYINAFKQRCNKYKNFEKGKNIFDEIFDFMSYIEINNGPKYYFFNYFIDDKQIFDYFDPVNTVKQDIKIKIIPTKYYGFKMDINQALLYLQREKFEKEKSEKIEKAKSKDDLINSFKSIDDILESGVFKEWSELYDNIRSNKSKYKIDTSYISDELSTSKFPSLRKKFTEKYNGFLEAELDEEIKEGLSKLKEVYKSVLDEYKVKIDTVKDIDELNNLKDINEHDLKNKIGNKPFLIEDKTLKKQLEVIINKLIITNQKIYENTKMTYVNEILEIYKNKMNEFKNAVLQEIANYYNLAVQEMKNNINNSADIDSLKKLGYEDKNVISTELTNKVNSKDSNLENKKKKYDISIDINTYVDDIFNEYKKKESSLKTGKKDEDNKDERHGSDQSSVETTKKDDKGKGNKSRCSNYKNKEQ